MKLCQKLLLSFLTMVSCAFSQPQPARAATSAVKAVTMQELAKQAAEREDRVEEFKFIRQAADRLGIRVWLFGGTAAGYLHYVKWDLQRERGDTRFQDDRFDYDFTNIYRSTQDLDIVVDGSPEQMQRLASELAGKYPHFLGSNRKWEVRSLRQNIGSPGQAGYKEALLDSFDFLNQNTDSNSTGMIEITRDGKESVIRDLRDWNNPNSNFLRDTVQDHDTFYRSKTHFKTARAKAGQNPEIFSVIRALTKAFQYELTFSAADWTQIQKISKAFKPDDIQDSAAIYRLRDMGKKLFMNAVNIEYAWDVLESLGLREKLMHFDAPTDNRALSWWMNKEPLRTYKLGTGKGATAKQLGLDIIAHETRDFLAYESITRAHTGDANVLSSRQSAGYGEEAIYGDGFYTRIGTSGARGTGLTIRFHLDPKARQGTDFTIHHNFVVVRNKAAVKVIPESLNMTPLEYFTFLANGQTRNNDLGIYEKLKRKINRDIGSLSKKDEKAIVTLVQSEIKKALADDDYNLPLLKAWNELSISSKYPEMTKAMMKRDALKDSLSERVLLYPEANADLILPLLKEGFLSGDMISMDIFSRRGWSQHPKTPEILRFMTKNDDLTEFMLVLKDPAWNKYTNLVPQVIKGGNADELLVDLLSSPVGLQHPEWVKAMFQRAVQPAVFFFDMVTVLSLPQWAGHPEFVQMLIPYAKSADKTQDLIYLLELPQWKGKKELIEQLIKDGIAYYYVFENILPLPEWQGRADLVLKMMKTQFCDTQVARLLALPGWTDPKLAKAVLGYKAFSSGEALMKAMVEQPAWAQYPEIIAEMIATYTSDYAQNVIAATVLSRKEWVDHPELLELMLTMPGGAEAVEKNILSQSHWQKSRALRELIPGIGKDRIHVEDLKAAIQDRQVPQKKAKSKAGKGLRCEAVFR